MSEKENHEANTDLIPNMQDEIALLCLAGLPRSSRAIARCVCRSWRNALSGNITSLRRCLRIPPDHLIFVALFDTECDPGYLQVTEENTRWLLLDPCTLATLILPNPLSRISTRTSLSSAAANNELFLPDIPAIVNDENLGFQSYSAEEARWRKIPLIPPVQNDQIRMYGCAGVGDFVYLGGGQSDLTGAASRSACRYDRVKNRWEPLPDMIMPRIDPAGVVKDGKFFVIGGCQSLEGYTRVHASGECYDPQTGRWTLVPNLWGNGLNYAEESNATQPAVAVLGEEFYAMQSHTNELMRFEPSTERWSRVGYVGGAVERNYRLRYKMMVVGEEVWVIAYAMGRNISIYAWNKSALHCREVKVAGLECYDHILTCTVLTA